ncbi:NAD(P)/FAD-dependent oxidoreductase [Arthrobacter sp. SD76]|uniref:NAD(P)/FAD-dependent oxidoreductase n=1 Tax=Arthrobacter sp. SD76 TaxID=3415007 RepID=UPI003C77EB4E
MVVRATTKSERRQLSYERLDVVSKARTDILIVGAGPAGLFATYYAGMRGLSVALVDSLPQIGGQTGALYPQKYIYDVAGFPAVKGRDLIAGLSEQAMSAHPNIYLNEECVDLEDIDDGLRVTTKNGTVFECGAVLITAGIGRFTPRPLPVVDDFSGSGIDVVVADPELYAGHQVVIVGGGDSAIDWANAIVPYAAAVHVVHRRARFSAHESSVEQLRASTAILHMNSEVSHIAGTEAVEAVTIRQARSGDEETITASTIIPALGHIASLGPLTSWGLSLRDRQIEVSTDMSTSRPRVYASGDITTYPGKVSLMVVGFGEAATAINNIAVALRPDEDLFPGHSSEQRATALPVA